MSFSLIFTHNGIFQCLIYIDVEYIYGFVRWGGLQAKSMTSQRAAFKMAGMSYYGNVMTTTRWLLYSTSTVQS